MSRDELRLKEGSVKRRTHRRSKAGWPGDRKRGSNSRFAVPFEGGTSGSSGSPEYGGRSKARRSRQSMNKRRQGDRSNKRRQKGSSEGPANANTQMSTANERSSHCLPRFSTVLTLKSFQSISGKSCHDIYLLTRKLWSTTDARFRIRWSRPV